MVAGILRIVVSACAPEYRLADDPPNCPAKILQNSPTNRPLNSTKRTPQSRINNVPILRLNASHISAYVAPTTATIRFFLLAGSCD